MDGVRAASCGDAFGQSGALNWPQKDSMLLTREQYEMAICANVPPY
jgi:hypothetical protein